MVDFLPLPDTFPRCDITDIYAVERKEFKHCFGKAFYNELLLNLATYDCIEWVEGSTVTAGETRSYKGIFYTANVDTTNRPTHHTDWSRSPKFKTECLENLWCIGSLGKYLAWCVLRGFLPFTRFRFNALGIVKMKGDDFDAISGSEANTMYDAIDNKIVCGLEVLIDYMRDNNESGCFDLYKGIANGCCGGCGCLDMDCECVDDCITEKDDGGRYEIY